MTTDGRIRPDMTRRDATRLLPINQQAVWDEAVKTAPNGKVTAAHVNAVAHGHQPAPSDADAAVAESGGRDPTAQNPAKYLRTCRQALQTVELCVERYRHFATISCIFADAIRALTEEIERADKALTGRVSSAS
jgi:hypothetical protein